MDEDEAQRRVDRVRAFREELAALEGEGVLALSAGQRADLAAHHERLLAELARAFDVDVTGEQKQLSWGMRIVAFLGAAALSAAVTLFFYRHWGGLETAAQVAVLVAAPLLGVLAVELVARRERARAFTAVAALVAFACFVLDLAMLGQIFNVTPSQNAFLVWAAFAFVLAYAQELRLLQIAGILCLLGYLSATMGEWGGCYWLSAGERPETIVVAGACIAGLAFIPHPRRASFPATYRLFGLLASLTALLVLGHWGNGSWLPLPARTVERIYQVAGFAASAAAIWAGVRFRWPGTANLGSAFFAILLYTKFYDWWWEWMPRYLFFLVVGLVAVLLLLVLGRLRTASRAVAP
jgi:uncharacterized membrane protein